MNMKKLILLICVATGLLSCKKDAADDITKYDWVIESATVTPAVTINGKTSTDMISLSGSGSCYTNLTLSFLENGIFIVGSNGALCDMVPNNNNQKWAKDGDVIKLTTDYGTRQLTLKGNMIIETGTYSDNSGTHELVSIYKAKSK